MVYILLNFIKTCQHLTHQQHPQWLIFHSHYYQRVKVESFVIILKWQGVVIFLWIIIPIKIDLNSKHIKYTLHIQGQVIAQQDNLQQKFFIHILKNFTIWPTLQNQLGWNFKIGLEVLIWNVGVLQYYKVD